MLLSAGVRMSIFRRDDGTTWASGQRVGRESLRDQPLDLGDEHVAGAGGRGPVRSPATTMAEPFVVRTGGVDAVAVLTGWTPLTTGTGFPGG